MSTISSSGTTMCAIGVSSYGPVENLQSRQVPRPPRPTGRQMHARPRQGRLGQPTRSTSRSAAEPTTAPLTRDEPHLHVMGYDGARGGDGHRPGREALQARGRGVLPRGPGGARAATRRRCSWTSGTRATGPGRRQAGRGSGGGEGAGILIVNGGGGVGSAAGHIARHVLGLPVVVTTASRPETAEFPRAMGATHVVDHRGGMGRQIRERDLPEGVPLKYAFITSRAEQYIRPVGDVLATFGKVCSTVQARFDMRGSHFMSKSLTFSCCWLGSGVYHGYVNDDEEKHHRWFEDMARMIDEGTLKCHLTRRIKLTLEGLNEAHREIEDSKCIGKIALGVDEDGSEAPLPKPNYIARG